MSLLRRGAFHDQDEILSAVSALSIELLAATIEGRANPPTWLSRVRQLAVPGMADAPPTLLVLDPLAAQARRATDELNIDQIEIVDTYMRLRPRLNDIGERRLAELLGVGDARAHTALEIMLIQPPEVVVAPHPRMVPLSVPSPYWEVVSQGGASTVGVLCRNKDGRLGLTACYHGTGPKGTPVVVRRAGQSLDSVRSEVALDDVVQDIVFIPLPAHEPAITLRGRAGVRRGMAPSQAELMTFEGAGSGRETVSTRIQSHDAGILRPRPTVQLRVQTLPNAEQGDSGAALVDENDRVVAFAFERTAIGEVPEFTDWIWAANALDALGLRVENARQDAGG